MNACFSFKWYNIYHWYIFPCLISYRDNLVLTVHRLILFSLFYSTHGLFNTRFWFVILHSMRDLWFFLLWLIFGLLLQRYLLRSPSFLLTVWIYVVLFLFGKQICPSVKKESGIRYWDNMTLIKEATFYRKIPWTPNRTARGNIAPFITSEDYRLSGVF